ncbi:hypothetical protein LJC19_07025 [Oxalobacter sp. OttesenSCG-928-P03]|nr:hypothetical protein [Oxalobacter sp. OttesenSCG-928-P03]
MKLKKLTPGKDFPADLRVIGRGTVVRDCRAILESKEYQEALEKGAELVAQQRQRKKNER